jgi:hypothetical protein
LNDYDVGEKILNFEVWWQDEGQRQAEDLVQKITPQFIDRMPQQLRDELLKTIHQHLSDEEAAELKTDGDMLAAMKQDKNLYASFQGAVAAGVKEGTRLHIIEEAKEVVNQYEWQYEGRLRNLPGTDEYEVWLSAFAACIAAENSEDYRVRTNKDIELPEPSGGWPDWNTDAACAYLFNHTLRQHADLERCPYNLKEMDTEQVISAIHHTYAHVPDKYMDKKEDADLRQMDENILRRYAKKVFKQYYWTV